MPVGRAGAVIVAIVAAHLAFEFGSVPSVVLVVSLLELVSQVGYDSARFLTVDSPYWAFIW